MKTTNLLLVTSDVVEESFGEKHYWHNWQKSAKTIMEKYTFLLKIRKILKATKKGEIKGDLVSQMSFSVS